jgi:hypothetical protein
MTCSDRKKCRKAEGSPKGCMCDCGGPSMDRPAADRSREQVPRRAGSASSRQNKGLRTAVLTFTAVAAITIGPLAITGAFDTSATGGGTFSVQVRVDLNKDLSALAAILGLRSIQGSESGASGPSYHPDCAKKATRAVKSFLTHNHCKQYATATRTVAKPGTTAQVAFTWVEMRTAALAGKYKAKVDKSGTGNPPGVSLAFNGYCYASGQQGATVRTVLVKPTGHVNADRKILQVAARSKLALSYLQRHCIS